MLRILILDDDPIFGHSLKRMLEGNPEHKYAPTAVTSATEALATVQQVARQNNTPFDVFLIDQRLDHGKDGLEVFLDLRHHSPDTDAIVFTIFHDESVVRRSYQVGAFRYLHKPVDIEELISVLESLRQWRQQQRERNWLRIINELARTTQTLTTLTEVAQQVVLYGQQLGFERVRMWRYDAQQDAMVEIHATDAANHTDAFSALIPARESMHVQRVLRSREVAIYNSDESAYICVGHSGTGSLSSYSEWALVPLWSCDACLGMLALDMPVTGGLLRQDQRQALALLGNQLSAVLERGILYNRIHALVEIGKTITSHAATATLPQLLREVYEQIGHYLNASNFLVALWNEQLHDLEVELEIRAGRRKRYKHVDRALLIHLMQRNESLLLLGGERDYCREHGLASSRHNSRCWLGVPLRLGQQAIGVVVVKSYEDDVAYTQTDQELLEAVAEQIAGAISAVRQKARAEANNRRHMEELRLLQQVLSQALNPTINQAILEAQPADVTIASLYVQSEKLLAGLLLQAARALLKDSSMQVALILRHWEHGLPTEEPREVRNRYILDHQYEVQFDSEAETLQGIVGWAFKHQRGCRIGNVRTPRWQRHFCEGVCSDTVSEMVVLIRLQDARPLGLFNVEAPEPDAFTHEHQKSLERLASVAALTLDNTYRQLRLRNVLEAARAVTTPYELNETLNAVIQAARASIPNLSAITIWYRSATNGLTHVVPGPYFGVHKPDAMREDSRAEDTPVTRIMASREPVWAPQADGHPILHSRFTREENIQAAAALPLTVDEDVIGVIFFNYRHKHTFTNEERTLFKIFASIAAASVRDALQLHQSELRQQRLNTATTITRAVGSALEINAVLSNILSALQQAFPRTYAAVLLYEPQEQSLHFMPASMNYYTPDNTDIADLVLKLDKPSLSALVARRAMYEGNIAPLLVRDVRTHPDYLPGIKSTRSQLTLALLRNDSQNGNGHAERRLLGVLVLERPVVDAFSEEDVALINSVGTHISLTIERAQQSEALQQSNQALQRSNEELQQSNEVAQNIAWAFQMAHDIQGKIAQMRHLLSPINTAPLAAVDAQSIADAMEVLQELLTMIEPASEIQVGSIDIDDWLQELLDRLLVRRKSKVQKTFFSGCTGLQAMVPTFYLELVFKLVINNALEAMEALAEDDKTLAVHTRPIGSTHFEVRIADTGAGIPEDIKAAIFQRRITAKSRERGRGLLFTHWITKVIIKGQVDIDNRTTQRGAECIFVIPLSQAWQQEHPDDR